MREWLLDWLQQHHYSGAFWWANGLMILSVLLISFMVYLFAHNLLFPYLDKRWSSSGSVLLKIMAKHQFFSRLLMVAQGLVVATMAKVWLKNGAIQEGVLNAAAVWIIVYALLAVFALLDIIKAYVARPDSPYTNFPANGIIQSVKLLVVVVAVLLIISTLMGKSPLLLLSGLGAMSAVMMLIFQNPILGFVAGIQLSSNRMLNKGDWLEMPQANADGEVIDIGLTTVKVQNWDNTVTMLPSYSLISGSFKNWQNMYESGGRRVMRNINVDAADVRFLSDDDTVSILKMAMPDADIPAAVEKAGEDLLPSERQTNLGLLRFYLETYLQQHPKVRHDLLCLVRQQQSDQNGIPLQIYCFLNEVGLVRYEALQSEMFDHIYAVLPVFGLKLFQSPSGYDLRKIATDTSGPHMEKRMPQ